MQREQRACPPPQRDRTLQQRCASLVVQREQQAGPRFPPNAGASSAARCVSIPPCFLPSSPQTWADIADPVADEHLCQAFGLRNTLHALVTFCGVNIEYARHATLYSIIHQDVILLRAHRREKRDAAVAAAGPPTAATTRASAYVFPRHVHMLMLTYTASITVRRARTITMRTAATTRSCRSMISVISWWTGSRGSLNSSSSRRTVSCVLPCLVAAVSADGEVADVLYFLGEYGQSTEAKGCVHRWETFVGVSVRDMGDCHYHTQREWLW